ncbi:redox-sensitive transcriptional activator SoxR [Thalassotalea sp. Y01]|uniref:redox-sensitive transcriptional activator SoxR n=1 Tax=Thalassotalea sp. Y01 TaxID=2729613 RepID=UPI00145D66B4|nr:redox-sensitive transcriptional activator SoxR [Thalassotalea sp. Y01]NMP15569.1 redox-sensitive transcriptional activator SoxR [Thalassotalea sp. Y01]
MEANLSVGQVAKRTGVKVSTLHFYETKGLITSWRNTGNQRRYKADVLRRISVIKVAQGLGVSLEEIKNVFRSLPKNRTPDKQDWQAISTLWQQQLEQRIVQLNKLKDSLDACIGCGCLSLKSCPLYNPDDTLAKQGVGAVLLNKR